MEICSGVLTVKISSVLKNKIFPSQRCVLYSGRNTLPPVVEISDHNGGSGKKKCIELEHCHWSKVGSFEPAFCINIKGKNYTFVAQSEIERKNWVLYLGCVTPELSERRHQLRMPKASENNYDGTVMEDNVLYSTTDQIYRFDVVADHNKGDCSLHNFKGIYSLAFDEHSISLLKHSTEIKVAIWTYYTIRSYGNSPHTVTFNVGTSSSTGEGMFSFLTTDGREMIEIIKQKTASIREKNLNKARSQANNSQPPSVTTASKPPVLPKTIQVSASGSAPVKSTNSASGIGMQSSVKRKPAPLAPFSSNAQASTETSSATRGPDFLKELNQSLANPSSPTPTSENSNKSLSSAASLESLSSVSSKKERKKQREKEKERKKLEEKEGRERAKKEKELEKARKKASKKSKGQKEESSSSVATVAEFDQSHIYAQADENYSSINHGASSKQIEGSYAYSDVNVLKDEMESGEAQYSAPWKDLLSSPTAYSPIEEENIYASPQKLDRNQQKRQDASVGDEYEDLDVQNAPPPEIPQRADENDEALNNIYDHFHVPAKKEENPENVYGIESASAPFSSVKKISPNVSVRRQVKNEKTDTDDYEYI